MAVEPLFVSSMAVLKSRLRLTGSTQADATAQIDKAVEDVRVGFYSETLGLGASRVTAILAVAFVENATTAAALVRTQANNLEITWVRLLLLRRLPTLFMDASGGAHEQWNDEPFGRNRGRELRDEIARLEKELQDGIGALEPDDEAGGILNVVVFEPATTPDRPGASLRPTYFSESG